MRHIHQIHRINIFLDHQTKGTPMQFDFYIFVLIVLFSLELLIDITLKQVTEDTTEYISDLSYRIKRGEQDALIKMPIGILFYDNKFYTSATYSITNKLDSQ